MGIDKEWGGIAEKHGLPSYDELNATFEIFECSDKFPLREVRRRIVDKMDAIASKFEDFIQPDGNFSTMHECQYMTDDRVEDMTNIVKVLRYFVRSADLLEVQSSDDENAEFIKQAWDAWKEQIPKIQDHMKFVVESWKKETDINEKVSYLG